MEVIDLYFMTFYAPKWVGNIIQVLYKVHNKMSFRPEFFYFLVLGKFLGKPSVGGGNKNKNKIQKFPVGIKIKIKVTKLSIFFIFFRDLLFNTNIVFNYGSKQHMRRVIFWIIFSKYVLGVLIRIISMRQIY